MKSRRYDLCIYFQDTPTPLYLKSIRHMQTEGGLLRIIFSDHKSQWWPLSNIANIREENKEVVEE